MANIGNGAKRRETKTRNIGRNAGTQIRETGPGVTVGTGGEAMTGGKVTIRRIDE
jgi:hypothetical protein